MSKVYFISDIHFHHKNILKFSGQWRDGDNIDEHNQIIVTRWNTTVNKRDIVYVLGDVCMGKDLSILGELTGTKILVLGNHDDHNVRDYLSYFQDIRGIFGYKGFWVSHAPIHPAELRNKKNIHGHVHSSSIKNEYGEYDKRYINVCCEVNHGYPIPFEDIIDGTYWNYKRC